MKLPNILTYLTICISTLGCMSSEVLVRLDFKVPFDHSNCTLIDNKAKESSKKVVRTITESEFNYTEHTIENVSPRLRKDCRIELYNGTNINKTHLYVSLNVRLPNSTNLSKLSKTMKCFEQLFKEKQYQELWPNRTASELPLAIYTNITCSSMLPDVTTQSCALWTTGSSKTEIGFNFQLVLNSSCEDTDNGGLLMQEMVAGIFNVSSQNITESQNSSCETEEYYTNGKHVNKTHLTVYLTVALPCSVNASELRNIIERSLNRHLHDQVLNHKTAHVRPLVIHTNATCNSTCPGKRCPGDGYFSLSIPILLSTVSNEMSPLNTGTVASAPPTSRNIGTTSLNTFSNGQQPIHATALPKQTLHTTEPPQISRYTGTTPSQIIGDTGTATSNTIDKTVSPKTIHATGPSQPIHATETIKPIGDTVVATSQTNHNSRTVTPTIYESTTTVSGINSGSTPNQANSSITTNPADSGSTTNPANSGSTTNHANSGSTTNHANSGSASNPANSGSTTNHENSGSASNPANSGSTTNHANSGSTTNPANSGSTTNQANSGSTTNHANSGSTTDPANSGSTSNPANSGSTTNHANSGSSTNPVNSGSTTNQANTGSTTNHANTGSTTNHANSGSASNQAKSSSTWNQANSGSTIFPDHIGGGVGERFVTTRNNVTGHLLFFVGITTGKMDTSKSTSQPVTAAVVGSLAVLSVLTGVLAALYRHYKNKRKVRDSFTGLGTNFNVPPKKPDFSSKKKFSYQTLYEE